MGKSIIKRTTQKYIANEPKQNVNTKHVPGFDLITEEILKQLPREDVIKITHIFTATFRLKYVPIMWKAIGGTNGNKNGKTTNVVTSYTSISLVLEISK